MDSYDLPCTLQWACLRESERPSECEGGDMEGEKANRHQIECVRVERKNDKKRNADEDSKGRRR